MHDYLNYSFEDTPEFMQYFDELPFWSAPFGLLLLEEIELFPNMTVADFGSGSGFPLFELAGRLGNGSKLFGIDPWEQAHHRATKKKKAYGYDHVHLLQNDGRKVEIDNDSIDLVVSNLGINNFERPDEVFLECYRILKPGGKLALTTNLNGHWKELYKVFEQTINATGDEDLINILLTDENHRGTSDSVKQLFIQSGFRQIYKKEQTYTMHFVNGSAFLNHHFIKPGWLSTWQKIFPKEDHEIIFRALEANLNTYSKDNHGLVLTVPILFMQGVK
jgi:ubiquinone/menaquinone biosynthesis C-methylase UbiE